MAQWSRIRLPMLETLFEDPTCCGATEPVCHNSSSYALEPGSHDCWSPSTLEAALRNQSNCHNQKPMHSIQRAAPAFRNWRKACAVMKTLVQPKINELCKLFFKKDTGQKRPSQHNQKKLHKTEWEVTFSAYHSMFFELCPGLKRRANSLPQSVCSTETCYASLPGSSPSGIDL